MKMYVDTSTLVTVLKLDDVVYEWESGRELARNFIKFLEEKLAENGAGWWDITEIRFFAGPGSFTGLRIGAAVVNVLADQLGVPLFDHHGARRKMIIPEYGRMANTSLPRGVDAVAVKKLD